uniref:Kelch repeat-containing protein n=1 Tax=Steinernema glaseri TaxID=37863 RepID=A0A1I7ZAG6_9BILA
MHSTALSIISKLSTALQCHTRRNDVCSVFRPVSVCLSILSLSGSVYLLRCPSLALPPMLRLLPPIVVIGGCRLICEREGLRSIETLDSGFLLEMKEKRRGASAMALSDTELLIVGGCSDAGIHLRSIEKVDLARKESEILGELDYDFSCVAFCPLQDGRLFIAGGYDGMSSIANVCVVTRDGKFEKFRPLPCDLKNSAAVQVEGRILLFGGWDGRRTLKSIIVYDVEKQSWEVQAGLCESIECHSATKVGSSVFLVGGFDSFSVTNKIYRYDLDSPNCEELPVKLSIARENHSTVAVQSVDGNKTLLVVIGGWDGKQALDSVEIFEVLEEAPWLLKVSEEVKSIGEVRNKPVALALPTKSRNPFPNK